MLRVMTYNLKFPSETEPDPLTRWSARRPLVAEVIGKVAPQVFGTQEGFYFQLREIAADTSYDWIGLGRNGGSHSEFSAIFFDPQVLEPLEFDHFWISETPERIASVSWNSSLTRMATWVRFCIRETGRQLIVLNTHLDHRSDEARIGGARLIAERVADFAPDLPVIVTGDFNCGAGHSAAFTELTRDSGLVDAWGPGNGPDCGTYGGWKAPEPGGHRIDWILTRGVEVADADVCDYHVEGQWPSDHVPAWADLLL